MKERDLIVSIFRVKFSTGSVFVEISNLIIEYTILISIPFERLYPNRKRLSNNMLKLIINEGIIYIGCIYKSKIIKDDEKIMIQKFSIKSTTIKIDADELDKLDNMNEYPKYPKNKYGSKVSRIKNILLKSGIIIKRRNL